MNTQSGNQHEMPPQGRNESIDRGSLHVSRGGKRLLRWSGCLPYSAARSTQQHHCRGGIRQRDPQIPNFQHGRWRRQLLGRVLWQPLPILSRRRLVWVMHSWCSIQGPQGCALGWLGSRQGPGIEDQPSNPSRRRLRLSICRRLDSAEHAVDDSLLLWAAAEPCSLHLLLHSSKRIRLAFLFRTPV